MAKNAPDAMLDASLDYVAQSDRIIVCSAEPTTYAEATSTYALATANATAVTDFPKAAGTPSGRKVTVAAKSGTSVTASGTATHIAVCRTTDSSLRYVTTCTSQVLTSGNTVNIPSWTITIPDPT